MALPMPRLAPVTIATVPRRRMPPAAGAGARQTEQGAAALGGLSGLSGLGGRGGLGGHGGLCDSGRAWCAGSGWPRHQ